MSLEQLHDLINHYMEENGAIRMYYRKNDGDTSIRVVEPLDWDNYHVFRAYCHLRKEERMFKLSNILEWQCFDSVEEALAYHANPPEDDGTADPPEILPAQRQTRPNTQTSRTTQDPLKPFSTITTNDEWSRLLKYYAQCIIREYQQQYELEKEYLKPFSFPLNDIEKFLLGEISLEFKVGYQLQQNAITSFIQNNQQNNNMQLCIGYPFLVMGANKIYPLIYSPLDIKADSQRVILQAEKFEVSYAALKSLRLEEDEILLFLEECEHVTPNPGQSLVEALRTLLIQKVSSTFQMNLPVRSNSLEPMSIFNAPALFWVSGNNITGNLIRELHDLAEKNWSDVSIAMKQLLTIQPDHEYLEVQNLEQDKNLYVTQVNQQQIRAVHASQSEPILIVTGPPGTGKSQLILNLIAQSFMNGESVLFASRNNQAVDVVMRRLQNELKFQGAIRTGNTENRGRAAQHMRAALNSIGSGKNPQAFHLIVQGYQVAREKILDAQSQLLEVRRLLGLYTSYKLERGTYLSFLPKNITKLVEANTPSVQMSDLDNLQNTMSIFLEGGLKLKEAKSQLENELNEIEVENSSQSDLIADLHSFEDQWGAFGGGFLKIRQYQKLSDLHTHLQTWFDLIYLIELSAQRIKISDEIAQTNEQLTSLKVQLPSELLDHLERCITTISAQKLKLLEAQSKKLLQWFKSSSEIPSGVFGMLVHWIRFGRFFKKKTDNLMSLQESLELRVLRAPEIRDLGLVGILIAAEELVGFISAVLLQQSLLHTESELQKVNEDFSIKITNLAEPIRNDLGKLGRFNFDHQSLRDRLIDLNSKVVSLTDQVNQLGERINRKIHGNDDKLQLLTEFASSIAGKDERLWQLYIPVEPEIIVSHVTKWHNILAFWKANAGMVHVQLQLAKFPNEENAILNVKRTSDELMDLSGEVMRATWVDRAQKADNELMQKVHDYVSALEALTREYDSFSYQYFKSMEQNNLVHAVKLFPIWATTNLAAKSNFPLSNGYFDVVIIDEASQCDIPSALPLLYRAKRIVIIGDPNQLRHVATINQETDLELAAKYGVGPDAYLYKVNSLFDLASRSSGSHPGTLLLNEHYRSDHRIISFSNREFYKNKLVIKTDLSVRNIRKTFLNEYGGIFWVNVAGQAEHARDSNFNSMELSNIQTLVPKLWESLRKHEMGGANLGIVTPYREQENQIQTWFKAHASPEGAVTIGTAHKFQGDERDFMIFSTVAAPGMSEGSIKWLDKEKNLLNVAVTRARITLIVVGNWNYCKTLPVSHAFRRLADYVEEQARVVSEIDSLPFFGKPAPNIIGYLTDPHNPEHNRTTLRRFISTCKEFVWWVDPYLTNHVVDLFWDVFQDPIVTIKQVQLITALEQTQPGEGNKKPPLNIEKFNQFSSELSKRGINISLRLLERRQLPHDRLLYAPSQSINMPPFSGAYGDHRHVSEYTQSLTERELFIKYWEQARPINLL
jgi:DNA polymerase III delta prime subunit